MPLRSASGAFFGAVVCEAVFIGLSLPSWTAAPGPVLARSPWRHVGETLAPRQQGRARAARPLMRNEPGHEQWPAAALSRQSAGKVARRLSQAPKLLPRAGFLNFFYDAAGQGAWGIRPGAVRRMAGHPRAARAMACSATRPRSIRPPTPAASGLANGPWQASSGPRAPVLPPGPSRHRHQHRARREQRVGDSAPSPTAPRTTSLSWPVTDMDDLPRLARPPTARRRPSGV